MTDALTSTPGSGGAAAPSLPCWEHFEHMADIGIRGLGNTLEEAFEQAALAMTAVIAEPASVRPLKPVSINCRSTKRELLLVDWLNTLVFEMANRRMLFSRFDVQIAGQQLAATAWGEPVDRARHRPVVEIKGATLTELRAGRDPLGRWIAQCIVDV